MMEIQNLTFRYPGSAAPVLSDVSLTLPEGEIGILMGPNGAGKTTLFKCLLGLVRPESGSIRLSGTELLSLRERERARRVAYVPQEIRFGALSVFDSVLMGRVGHFGLAPGEKDREKAAEVLSGMGLLHLKDRNAETLSGGEKQKVAIARAVAQEPELIVFDEPTGNLDIANELLVMEEAKRLSKEKGITILASLHDINQALSLGQEFFFLKDGKLLYAGGMEIISPSLLEEVYGVPFRMAEVDGTPVFLGGKT